MHRSCPRHLHPFSIAVFVLLVAVPAMAEIVLEVDWQHVTDSPGWAGRRGHAMVAFDDKLWVMGGYSGDTGITHNDVWYTSDGATWTEATSAAAWAPRSGLKVIEYQGAMWLSGGASFNDVWRSTDGVNWEQITAGAGWSGRAKFGYAELNNKLWVLGGAVGSANNKQIYSTSNGIDWTLENGSPAWDSRNGHGVTNFNGAFWLTGGYTTTTRTSGAGTTHYAKDIWRSTNGANWTLVTSSAPWGWRGYHVSAAWKDRLWVVGGQFEGTTLEAPYVISDAWYTVDGNDWFESIPTGTAWEGTYLCAGAVWRDKLWITGGSRFLGGTEYYKDDVWVADTQVPEPDPDAPPTLALNWTQVTSTPGWDPRQDHSAFVFNDKLWVVGGNVSQFSTLFNDVWYTDDGVNWVEATASAPWFGRFGQSALVFDGAMWLMGGYNDYERNDVWRSTDGINWTQVTANAAWPARFYFSTVDFQGKMWLFGGDSISSSYDIYNSTDGAHWTRLTTAAPFGLRYNHAAAVHDGALWLTGGHSNNVSKEDQTWRSANGSTWAATSDASAWGQRWGHASVSWEGKLWVLGGQDGSLSRYNDAWYTADGIDWIHALPAKAPWTKRTGFASVVWHDKLWVLGGNQGRLIADVWAADLAVAEGEGEGEGQAPPGTYQTADQDQDNTISLAELSRVIQFYNSGGFHCALPPSSTEDGYAPGPSADQACALHASDYSPQDWRINLSELLRTIQFYVAGSYHYCPTQNTEDGYCVGP